MVRLGLAVVEGAAGLALRVLLVLDLLRRQPPGLLFPPRLPLDAGQDLLVIGGELEGVDGDLVALGLLGQALVEGGLLEHAGGVGVGGALGDGAVQHLRVVPAGLSGVLELRRDGVALGLEHGGGQLGADGIVGDLAHLEEEAVDRRLQLLAGGLFGLLVALLDRALLIREGVLEDPGELGVLLHAGGDRVHRTGPGGTDALDVLEAEALDEELLDLVREVLQTPDVDGELLEVTLVRGRLLEGSAERGDLPREHAPEGDERVGEPPVVRRVHEGLGEDEAVHIAADLLGRELDAAARRGGRLLGRLERRDERERGLRLLDPDADGGEILHHPEVGDALVALPEHERPVGLVLLGDLVADLLGHGLPAEAGGGLTELSEGLGERLVEPVEGREAVAQALLLTLEAGNVGLEILIGRGDREAELAGELAHEVVDRAVLRARLGVLGRGKQGDAALCAHGEPPKMSKGPKEVVPWHLPRTEHSVKTPSK